MTTGFVFGPIIDGDVMTFDLSDLGVRLAVVGAEIGTAYFVDGSGANTQKIIYAGRPPRIRYLLAITTAPGTAMTALDLKVEASDDGSGYYDVDSLMDDADVPSPQVENQVVLAAGATKIVSLTVDGSYKHLRLAMKTEGGAGSVGDSISVSARMLWT